MLVAALSIATILSQEPEVKRFPSLTGNITHIKEFESKVLGNKRNLIVYLPPGYEEDKTRRYPVLYCHDGQNIFDGATSYIANKEWRIDEAAESLIKAGLIEPIIIVGVDNGRLSRGDEYLPTRITLNNKSQMGGGADKFGEFLIDEVKTHIDRTYRTKPDGKNTAMLGSSFGGVITYYLGLTRPDKFSRLAVMSPSLWVNDRELIKRTHDLPRKLNLKIWLDMGTYEGADAVRDARNLLQALEKKGWKSGRDVVYYEDGFALHYEDAWARRVPAILMWMYGTRR